MARGNEPRPDPVRSRPPWWLYALSASFLGYFVLLGYSVFFGPRGFGIQGGYSEGRRVVSGVAPESPAERGGLQAGDHIVSVEGRMMRSEFVWMGFAASLQLHRDYRFEISREGQSREVVLRIDTPAWRTWDRSDWALAIVWWGGKLIMLSLAALIAFRRLQDKVALLGAWLLATVPLIELRLPNGFAASWNALPVLLGLPLWIPLISTFLGATLLFTFLCAFPRPLFRGRRVWVLVWLPAFILVSAFLPFFFGTIYRPEQPLPPPRWQLLTLVVALIAYVLGGLLALITNYRRLQEISERRRLRILVIGAVVGWVAVLPAPLATYGLPALTPYVLNTPAILCMAVLFQAFPLSFAYAILRHRVFDLGVLLRQGLQYALARRLILSLAPAFAAVLLLDLLLHGDQPLLGILGARGWVYLTLGGLALVAHAKRRRWTDSLDRHFFRERYDAQRLLREVAAEVRQARNLEKVAPRLVAQIEAALHPEFAALLARDAGQAQFRSLASAPPSHAAPTFAGDSKLAALVRLLGQPLEVPHTESGWLHEQLPREESEFLRRARVGLLVPVAASAEGREALLILGVKRSEEPYGREDLDLLVAIGHSLALLLEHAQSAEPVRMPAVAFEECPQCGTCYDSGVGRCGRDSETLLPVHAPRLLGERYRLERRLGRGGMGTVYEARDTQLARRVAVKLIREDLLGNAEAAERFRREARAAAGLAHPNVVTVHDFGIAAGNRAYLVMELLQGASLREELERCGRLPASRALQILRGVCAAVDAAHRRQLIHRDLKPENIFLVLEEDREVAKVLDFGVAKTLPTDTQATADTDPTALLGTWHYMGPEQLRGLPVDVSWDLWALAVLTYETLAGNRPFQAGSSAEWHSAVLSGRFVPITAHLPDASANFQEFFADAFATERQRRPASAASFMMRLESVLT